MELQQGWAYGLEFQPVDAAFLLFWTPGPSGHVILNMHPQAQETGIHVDYSLGRGFQAYTLRQPPQPPAQAVL